MKTIKRYESWRSYWRFFLFSFFLVPVLCVCLISEFFILNVIGAFASIVWLVHFTARLSVILSNRLKIEGKELEISKGYTKTVIPIQNITDVSVQQSSSEKLLGIGSIFINTKLKHRNCCMWRISNPKNIKQVLLKIRNNLRNNTTCFPHVIRAKQ